MAAAAMIPRSLERAFRRLSLPAEMGIGTIVSPDWAGDLFAISLGPQCAAPWLISPEWRWAGSPRRAPASRRFPGEPGRRPPRPAADTAIAERAAPRSEEHTSEPQSR